MSRERVAVRRRPRTAKRAPSANKKEEDGLKTDERTSKELLSTETEINNNKPKQPPRFVAKGRPTSAQNANKSRPNYAHEKQIFVGKLRPQSAYAKASPARGKTRPQSAHEVARRKPALSRPQSAHDRPPSGHSKSKKVPKDAWIVKDSNEQGDGGKKIYVVQLPGEKMDPEEIREAIKTHELSRSLTALSVSSTKSASSGASTPRSNTSRRRLRKWKPKIEEETSVTDTPRKNNKSASSTNLENIKEESSDFGCDSRRVRSNRYGQFKYPQHLHYRALPNTSTMETKVPCCMRKFPQYTRLPLKQSCRYTPWGSVSYTCGHTVTSNHLPHPRSRERAGYKASRPQSAPPIAQSTARTHREGRPSVVKAYSIEEGHYESMDTTDDVDTDSVVVGLADDDDDLDQEHLINTDPGLLSPTITVDDDDGYFADIYNLQLQDANVSNEMSARDPRHSQRSSQVEDTTRSVTSPSRQTSVRDFHPQSSIRSSPVQSSKPPERRDSNFSNCDDAASIRRQPASRRSSDAESVHSVPSRRSSETECRPQSSRRSSARSVPSPAPKRRGSTHSDRSASARHSASNLSIQEEEVASDRDRTNKLHAKRPSKEDKTIHIDKDEVPEEYQESKKLTSTRHYDSYSSDDDDV